MESASVNQRGRQRMSEDKVETNATAPRQSRDVTDPAEIARMLGELAGREDLLFLSRTGTNLSVVAKAVGVDAQRGTFRIAVAAGDGGAGNLVGSAFGVFAPMRNADLAFAAERFRAVPEQEGTYDVAMPATLRLSLRREHPRGSCFGLVDVVIRGKGQSQSETMKATLHDISNAGLGLSLPEGMEANIRAGDEFEDCMLLLNNKPMAMCAIEVLHTRRDAETGCLIAGARLVNLDDVARERIAKLIAVLDPLWGEARHPAED
jgi:c-di-GMP-binding flagellar brake protein YcgR